MVPSKRRQVFTLVCVLVTFLMLIQFRGNSTPIDVDKIYHNEVIVGKYVNAERADSGGQIDLNQNDALNKWVNSSDYAPFEEVKPKFLHIISYQRSGSSFLGDIFHNTPGVFFIYEPLDALYSAMYGTPAGWNVPSDIFYDSSGEQREIPKEEINTVKWTLETIFACRMSKWPPAMLMHKFFRSSIFTKRMTQINGYGKCLANHRVPSTTECQMPIRNICGRRFDSGKPEAVLCRDVLWNSWKWNSTYDEVSDRLRYESTALMDILNNRQVLKRKSSKSGKDSTRYSEYGIAEAFGKYFSCLRGKWNVAKQCAVEHLDNVCKNSTMRVVKTVRASLASDQDLLLNLNNFRLAHLVRDPRGAARSRFRLSWSQGLHERKNITQEAISYCKAALSNQALQRESEILLQTTSRTKNVIYDNLVEKPLQQVAGLFEFLGYPMPEQTKDWLANHTVNVQTSYKEKGKIVKEVRNATEIAAAWKDSYTKEELEIIWNGCLPYFDVFPSNWIKGFE